MTIAALPEATTRLLGSSQALTTPTSLVKELIDNALDAKATAIDILISPNTIDKIEVRDNGHGIPQEDVDALGRPGHTSKLRSFDELRFIGGLSLGFRGEALASAVELGEVSVTTRTEGEPVATHVKLKRKGGIASQSRTSNPVGTTVTVSKFLSRIPVREQTALKNASKMLSKLKDLLQGYCLARPRVKFSLKLMKSPKSSWSYAPRPNDGIKEAVSLVVSRDTANQCFEKSLEFSELSSSDHTLESKRLGDSEESSRKTTQDESTKFVVDMFLPKPDCDISKIGHGQFISVDSRPVSHEKGTIRKIITLFRSYLKDTVSEFSEKFRNPFLWMNIQCPTASYDANIEPAKDDVLFSNEELLLKTIESAFEGVYGKRKELPAQISRTPLSNLDNFELLKARRPAQNKSSDDLQSLPPTANSATISSDASAMPNVTVESIPGAFVDDAASVGDPEPEILPRPRWSIGMSVEQDGDGEDEGLPKRNHRTLHANTRQSSVTAEPDQGNSLNPWLIAQLNAPIRREQPIHDEPGPRMNPFLPTPNSSSDPVPSTSDLDEVSGQSPVREIGYTENIERLSLPVLQPQTHLHRLDREASPVFHDLLLGTGAEPLRRSNDFVSARRIADGSMAFQEPPRSITPKWSSINKPFVAPKRTNGNSGSPRDGFRQTKFGTGDRAPRTVENPEELPEDANLEWAMDFERRKEEATQARREELRAARQEAIFRQAEDEKRFYGQSHESTESITDNSPHKNRYNAAIATLEADGESHLPTPAKTPLKTSLPDGDPRAYLMKRQRSMSVRPGETRQLSRRKSMKLPLERIPTGQNLHSLLLPVMADTKLLQNTSAKLKETDMYIQRGMIIPGIVLHGSEKDDITSRVKAVVENWKGWKGDMFGGNEADGDSHVPLCA